MIVLITNTITPIIKDLHHGHFNIDTSLNVDVSDVAHLISRRVEIDDALVDTHLEAIEGDRTLTARSLAGGDLQDLGRHAHRARDLELLVESLVLELRAHCLNIRHN